MKFLFSSLFILFIACSIQAQTKHIVSVVDDEFIPANISITQGDTVLWVCNEGWHNVSFADTLYPNNPESFGNEVTAPGWELSHVFTILGHYDYQCEPHVLSGMVGTVTVEEEVTAIEDFENLEQSINVFPNPSKGLIQVSSDFAKFETGVLILTGIDGVEVYRNNNFILNQTIDLSKFPAQMYLLKLTVDSGTYLEKIMILK